MKFEFAVETPDYKKTYQIRIDTKTLHDEELRQTLCLFLIITRHMHPTLTLDNLTLYGKTDGILIPIYEPSTIHLQGVYKMPVPVRKIENETMFIQWLTCEFAFHSYTLTPRTVSLTRNSDDIVQEFDLQRPF